MEAPTLDAVNRVNDEIAGPVPGQPPRRRFGHLVYTQGFTDFLNVLVAEGSLYAAEGQLVQSQAAISDDLIASTKPRAAD